MEKIEDRYTIHSSGSIFGLYDVYFDGMPLFLQNRKALAQQIAGALNGAYYLGYMKGKDNV